MVVVVALLGCGCGVAAMPEDATSVSCLDAAGVEADGADGADERREAFTEEAMNGAVAVAAYVHQIGGLPASFETWQAETGTGAGAEVVAVETPPCSVYVSYSQWCANGDPASSVELDEPRDWVRNPRGRAAGLPEAVTVPSWRASSRV